MNLIPNAWPEANLYRPALISRAGQLLYVSGLLFDCPTAALDFARTDLLVRIQRQRQTKAKQAAAKCASVLQVEQ